MVIQAACPNPDVIRDLLDGNLPEVEQSELSSHFDLCSTCQQQFDREASGSRFLGDVSRLCSDSEWQQNTPTLDRLMRDMPQQLSDAADEASVATWSTEAVADFLDTSENADHLGRLGSYEIVEVIGRGGMGIVLRGIDSRLNRVVAIKVLAPELASNPNARRRFYREGQAAAAVSHDHVVTIHAVDDHERLPYLVMEFVAGESLEECIRRTGPLPLESVLRMGRQAALGLAAAHEVGLVHRDMKPANILLENGIQRVRITDFGLARATDDVSMTQTGTVTGTPLYMSPEQAGGEKIDHRSDLFSLGSVLYTMCTGRPAFRAQTTLGVIKRVCEDTPRPIRDVNPDIPQWLVDIIDRLMAKQPDDRIQDAAELAELLGSHLAHVQDPENVPAPAGAKSGPKQRTLKSLILFVLLIGGVGLGITEASGVTNVSEFLGIVLRLKTPEGTLVIEIEDPNVEVAVEGSEVIISGVTKKELRLKPGKYQYTAIREGQPAESEWVTIERDGRTVVRIRQLPTDIVGVAAEGEMIRSATQLAPNLEGGGYEQASGTPRSEPIVRPEGDGIRLLSPVRVRRMLPDQLAPVWFGKWYFKQIPEQLYGQNFAFVSRDGGLLEFDVTEVNGRKLNQRIWLLIPHQDWDGSWTTSIPEDLDPSLKFATRDGLLAFGWSAWNDITSEHIRVTPDQPERHMKWSVFYRDAKPGERYRVRTHWKHTPMLVWGSTQLDNVVVEPEWDQRVAVFEPGATVPLGNGHLVFEHVPEAINGRLFTKRNGYQGAARFRVTSDQKVTVAMYEWGHEHEGNASGNWMPELTSRRKMVEQGWQAAGEVASRHSDPKQLGVNWFLYTRDCKAGESFLLRNHKYQAPLVFSEKTYFEGGGPVDVDPPAMEALEVRQAEERLALLVEQFNSKFKQERYAEAFVIALQMKRKFPSSPVADLMLSKSQAAMKNTAQVRVLPHPSEADDPVNGATDSGETKLDQDAAELKRLAVLAIVTKPAGHEDAGRAMSSPLNIDISELITRAGQLQDVLDLPKEPEALRGFLDKQRQAGNKWVMCAALDIENPDSKIVAAKALTKLADPDTVSVLLIAAKRNAYAVPGSENATLHSIFQAELKGALEAATGLKLSKAGLTINVPALGPATGEALDEFATSFLAGTDFAKVDTWLRNVYLADASSSLAPAEEPDPNATPAAGGIPVPHTSHLGLIGRLAMRIVSSGSEGEPSNRTQFDPGYIFQYVPGQFFHRDVLPLDLIEDHRFVVTLNGQLVVPHDMVAKIWHAGGGVSHDQCRLYVDDRLLGVVGDNTDKHNIYEVPLLKGRHDIRWELTGGTFRTNMLVVQDGETGEQLEIVNPGPESLRQSPDDKVVQIQSNRPDWPVSAKADWLPKTVVITETD